MVFAVEHIGAGGRAGFGFGCVGVVADYGGGIPNLEYSLLSIPQRRKGVNRGEGMGRRLGRRVAMPGGPAAAGGTGYDAGPRAGSEGERAAISHAILILRPLAERRSAGTIERTLIVGARRRRGPMPIFQRRPGCPGTHTNARPAIMSMTGGRVFGAAPEAECPRCDGLARRKFHAVPVIYKGSGFYTTDYARKK